jgi:hypothetical protein
MNVPTVMTGKKIETHKGNLFICLIEKIGTLSNTFFFYMKKNGERFVSPKEIEWGMTPTSQAWGDAKIHWENAKVENLTEKELEWAQKLKGEIFDKKNPRFGFTTEELKKHLEFVRKRSAKKIVRPK